MNIKISENEIHPDGVQIRLNEKLVKIYDEESRSLLERIVNAIGINAITCYASTDGYINVGALMMPVRIVTEVQNDSELYGLLEDIRKEYPLLIIKHVSRVPSGFVRLAYTGATSGEIKDAIDSNPKLKEVLNKMSKEQNTRLVNPKLEEAWGGMCNSTLVSLARAMGDLASTIYISTRGEFEIVSTADNFDEVLERFKNVTMRFSSVKVHSVDRVPDKWEPLCIEIKICSEDDCEYELNPELATLYEEGSVEKLNKLIAMVGNAVAPTIMVSTKCGVKYVNGIKMPNLITTESAQVNYVTNCVRLLYNNWGGEALAESIEVSTEMVESGDVKLAVPRNNATSSKFPAESVFTDIAAMMSGE